VVGATGENEGRKGLSVLLADEDEGALRITAERVRALGHVPIEIAVDAVAAAEAIARDDPDVSIVVVDHDDDVALGLMEEIVAFARGPVIALIDKEDSEFIAEAAGRGIFAYARQETPESIQGAIEVATRRFEEQRALLDQVERLEGALERRAIIERAKGILMERHSISEEQAFAMLRDRSRSTGHKLVDIAQAVVDAQALLPDTAKHPANVEQE
jgi:AmiR/NasT family two-component response regulator